MLTIDQAKEKYKDHEKNEELTKKIVSNYLSSKYGHISSLDELIMNITTGVNARWIDYDLVEREYTRIRG